MAWEPIYPAAECITRSISLPLFTKVSMASRIAWTSEEKVLAFGPSVPVLASGIVWVGKTLSVLRMLMTLEKTAGPSQNPGMKTRVGLTIWGWRRWGPAENRIENES